MTNAEKYSGRIGLALLCTAFLAICFWHVDSFSAANVLLFICAIFAAMFGLILLCVAGLDWLGKESK